MKSYLHGLITGAVLVFAFMVLIGGTYYDVDDVMRKLRNIESDVSSIASDVSSIRSDVSTMSYYGVDCN